jgi:hypothetical protein
VANLIRPAPASTAWPAATAAVVAAVVVVTAVAMVAAMAVATAALAAAVVAVASVADPHRFPKKKSPHMRALFLLAQSSVAHKQSHQRIGAHLTAPVPVNLSVKLIFNFRYIKLMITLSGI